MLPVGCSCSVQVIDSPSMREIAVYKQLFPVCLAPSMLSVAVEMISQVKLDLLVPSLSLG